MRSADSLGADLLRWAKERGVETLVAVIKNPDAMDVVAVRVGDACWSVGALKLIEQEVIDNWVTIKGGDNG